jgi:hypothetical protein
MSVHFLPASRMCIRKRKAGVEHIYMILDFSQLEYSQVYIIDVFHKLISTIVLKP